MSTPRPDSLWRALVDVFAPEKGQEGDGDPYGAGAIPLGPDSVAALRKIAGDGWTELEPLAQRAEAERFWLHREP